MSDGQSIDAVDASPMENWPCVSVIVASHNRPAGLDRCLSSIYDQIATFRDFEVVVCDDASDCDKEIAECLRKWTFKFADAGIDLVAMRFGECSGYACAPRNACIEMARGDYIAVADDDNAYLPGALAAMVEAMTAGEAWPQLVYGRWRYVKDSNVTDMTVDGVSLPEGDTPLVEPDVARICSSPMNNYIDTMSFMTSRGLYWTLQEVTGAMWNEKWRRFGDWELIVRAIKSGVLFRMHSIDRVLFEYHWGGDNLQLTRPFSETPVPQSMTTGEVLV